MSDSRRGVVVEMRLSEDLIIVLAAAEMAAIKSGDKLLESGIGRGDVMPRPQKAV